MVAGSKGFEMQQTKAWLSSEWLGVRPHTNNPVLTSVPASDITTTSFAVHPVISVEASVASQAKRATESFAQHVLKLTHRRASGANQT